MGEANVLWCLGDLENKLGRLEEARRHYENAHQLYQAIQDRLGEANALYSLGELERKLGRNNEARRYFETALGLFHAVQNRWGEANALFGLGEVELKLGRSDEARRHYTDARQLYQADQNNMGEANVLRGLGDLESILGRNDEARKDYEDARQLSQAVQHRLGEANAFFRLGDLESKLGRNDEARRDYEDARRLYRAVENRLGEANVLRGWGHLERKLGRSDQACKTFRDAAILFGLAGMQADKASMESLADSKMAQRVVALIHGIRTAAVWAEGVARVLQQSCDVVPKPIRYGYFDTLQFLFPWGTREAPVQRVTRQIRTIRNEYPDAEISVIGHSFGTYIISKILEQESDITFHHVVLCGSVIDANYRWDLVRSRVKGRVVNDCGTRDIWPVLAQGATWGYGATGTLGMSGAIVSDRFHPYGHSDFFNEEFVINFWVPLFKNDELVPSVWNDVRPPPPYWMHILGSHAIRWILLAILFLAAATFLSFVNF